MRVIERGGCIRRHMPVDCYCMQEKQVVCDGTCGAPVREIHAITQRMLFFCGGRMEAQGCVAVVFVFIDKTKKRGPRQELRCPKRQLVVVREMKSGSRHI